MSALEKAKISKISGVLLLLFAMAVLFSQSLMDFFASLLCFYLLWQWLKAKFLKTSFSPIESMGFEWLWVLWFSVAALGFAFNTPPPSGTPDYFWISRLMEFRWILILYFIVGAFRLASFNENAMKWFNGAALLFSSYALGDYFFNWDNDPLQETRLGGVYRFAMTHAHVYGIVFCFLLGFFFINRFSLSNKMRFFFLVTMGTVGASVILTHTRGAWIALLVSVVVMSFFWKFRSGLLALFFSIALVSGLYTLVPSVKERIDFTTRIANPEAFKTSYDQERIVLWKTNWMIFKDHPWLGTGLGQNKFHLRSYYNKQDLPDTQFISHAHNQYLQFLAGSGILGLFCYLGALSAFLVLTLKALCKLPKNQNFHQGLALGALGGQVFFSVGGLTESNFEHSKVRYAVMLMWGLGFWLWRKASRS